MRRWWLFLNDVIHLCRSVQLHVMTDDHHHHHHPNDPHSHFRFFSNLFQTDKWDQLQINADVSVDRKVII